MDATIIAQGGGEGKQKGGDTGCFAGFGKILQFIDVYRAPVCYTRCIVWRAAPQGRVDTIHKKIAWASIIGFIGLSCLLGAFQLAQGSVGRALLGFASPLFLLVPVVMRRVVGGHPCLLYAEGFLFCSLSYALGSVLLLFDTVPYLDKIAHFLSGFLFSTLGFCLYLLLNRQRLKAPFEDALMCASYGVFFSCFVAVLWEIFEFCGFFLLGMDSQHHLTTGVMDTMGDLITCFAGSVLCAASLLLTARKGRRLVTGAVVQDFYHSMQPGDN